MVGGLLFLGGNGAVVWAQQYVPSGVAALLVAIEPILFVLLDGMRRRKRPRRTVMIGLALGLVGERSHRAGKISRRPGDPSLLVRWERSAGRRIAAVPGFRMSNLRPWRRVTMWGGGAPCSWRAPRGKLGIRSRRFRPLVSRPPLSDLVRSPRLHRLLLILLVRRRRARDLCLRTPSVAGAARTFAGDPDGPDGHRGAIIVVSFALIIQKEGTGGITHPSARRRSPPRNCAALALIARLTKGGLGGPNLRGALRGVRAKDAAWRPSAGRHNIWELALHAAYWKYAVWRRLTGGGKGQFAAEGSNWFVRPESAVPDEKAWRADLALLTQEHRRLREAVRSFPPERLHARSS